MTNFDSFVSLWPKTISMIYGRRAVIVIVLVNKIYNTGKQIPISVADRSFSALFFPII
jgi:hypothetical protein